MHTATSTFNKLEKEVAKQHYDEISARWLQQQQQYESYIEKAEKRWYMSPFELQAVTYFIEARHSTTFALEKLEKWVEQLEEEEQGRVVLNHGNLSPDHFLIDDEGSPYLINFEKASYSSPIYEFIYYYRSYLNQYPFISDECVNLFYTYQSQCKWTEAEKSLFMCYMAYPHNLYQVINEFKQGKLDEMTGCKLINKKIWQMKNIEFVVLKIKETEDKENQEKVET
ncbi:phosphotransferase [Bacillus carboniphilus]|uniref:Phosphotransferase n=1 Tax=Bacillus carboniphilus TaxID=86663 RepID=A0ABY9JXJ6_9BACI|nr:phosphotransferase [Bacillus carboniphilus]WLR44097.1 phosphotransferase [Bacillus carboniphilus]